jgi:putative membrane protein
MGAAEYVKNAFIGIIMGIFMMMPGASGATISVVFGVYERLIRDVAMLKTYFIKDIKFILTIGLGGLVGVLICAKGLDFLIDRYEIPLMFMFAALILVQIPDIWKQADDGEKLTGYNILALVCGFAVMIVVLFIGQASIEQQETPGVIPMLIAGMIFAICAISPGISGSTLLLALGLFTMVIDSLGDLKLSAILPLLVGAVLGVILFAKLISHCVNNHRKSTYCVIIGLTAGSIVTVVAEAIMKMGGDSDLLVPCIVATVVGLIIGWAIHMISTRIMKADQPSEGS